MNGNGRISWQAAERFHVLMMGRGEKCGLDLGVIAVCLSGGKFFFNFILAMHGRKAW